MVEEILINNSKQVDKNLIQYTLQLRALNYLKGNNKIDEKIYRTTKDRLNKNLYICK